MKKFSSHLVISVTLLASVNIAHAQLGKFSNPLASSSSSSGASAEQIVTRYVGGAKSVMQADSKMLDAIGLKDEAAKAALQATNLTQGATKDNLETAEKVQTESSKALEEKLNGKKVSMDAASKKLFTAGLQDLGSGLIQYVGLSKDAANFKPSMGSVGSANSAVYVAKSLPGSIKNLASTLKMAIEFSKANDIPVPKEANDATAML